MARRVGVLVVALGWLLSPLEGLQAPPRADVRGRRIMLSATGPGEEWTSRRRALEEAAAAGLGLVGLGGLPLPAGAADAGVPVSQLVGQLSSAPARHIVITGSNSGVGLAGAKMLTAAGHRVTCACRTAAKAEAAAEACNQFAAAGGTRAGGQAVPGVCDLSDLDSVRAFAASLESTNAVPMDSLCLNAGLAHSTADKEPSRTRQGFEETVGVNHLGHFLLANLLVNSLAKRPAPRVVVTASPVHDPTSGGGNVGSPATLGDLAGLESGAGFDMVDGGPFDADKAYKDSKLCNMLFMAEAARRWGPQGVSVNAFSPGLIASPEGFFRYQNPIFARAFNVISQVVGVAETNEFGGSAMGFLSVDPAVQGASGGWYDSFPPGKHQLFLHPPSGEAQDQGKQQRLWELSAALTGLTRQT